MRRQVELEDASPYNAAPAARAEHAARLSEAQGAAAGTGFRGGARALAITSRLARKQTCKSGKCKAAAPEKDNEGQNDTIFKIPPFGLILLPEAVGLFYVKFAKVHIRLPIF